MSWASELVPRETTLREIVRDLALALRSYKDSSLTPAEILGFLLLRLVQRLSYARGWSDGRKSMATGA